MLGGEYILTREEVGFVAEQKAAYSGRPPKLLDRLREALRSRHYSRRTEQTNCPGNVSSFQRRHTRRQNNDAISYPSRKCKRFNANRSAPLFFFERHVIGRKLGKPGNFMPIRITCRNNWPEVQQVVERRVFIDCSVRNRRCLIRTTYKIIASYSDPSTICSADCHSQDRRGCHGNLRLFQEEVGACERRRKASARNRKHRQDPSSFAPKGTSPTSFQAGAIESGGAGSHRNSRS